MLVTSAAIISALHSAASLFISPMRNAIGALVKVIFAPCCTACCATFHAIEFSFNAPKMMPLLPANKLFDIIFFILLRLNIIALRDIY